MMADQKLPLDDPPSYTSANPYAAPPGNSVVIARIICIAICAYIDCRIDSLVIHHNGVYTAWYRLGTCKPERPLYACIICMHVHDAEMNWLLHVKYKV